MKRSNAKVNFLVPTTFIMSNILCIVSNITGARPDDNADFPVQTTPITIINARRDDKGDFPVPATLIIQLFFLYILQT